MRVCVVAERKFLYALNLEHRSALHRLINNTVEKDEQEENEEGLGG